MSERISFDDFREEWLEDVKADSPSTLTLGQRFAHKLFTQWRDISVPSDDLIYCDGTGDGGIDIAYLERGEASTDGDNETGDKSEGEILVGGDTWYLVQGKYGAGFQGSTTLLQEGRKLIDTLSSGQNRLSEITGNLLKRIDQFLQKADSGERGDRLVYVFATELPLSTEQKRMLDDIRVLGRDRFGNIFDVEAISIETIYLNQLDDPLDTDVLPIKVSIEATMANSGKDLMVGSIALLNLYEFLKAYRSQTENLDQIYEKNVRRFLGGRGRVNRGMQATLKEDPAQFGLYNNGITIVVNHFETLGRDKYLLTEPYIVNGCQTTRTIWEVCLQKLESGGKGADPKLEEWQDKARDGVVVAKIVKVGNLGEQLLQNITRYTNSQNAVRDKDFVTLEEGFQRWKKEMGERCNIFLEVQRGGWDSQKAFQKQNLNSRQFKVFANAFDLLKVYGAGWMREAGKAFGSNIAFVPGGPLYRHIIEGNNEFGVYDLYAAYRLQEAADKFGFGRGAVKTSRRQTRYLFYLVAIDLLRDIMVRANLPTSPTNLTQAFLKVYNFENEDVIQELYDAAIGVVDEYLTQGEEDSIFGEPEFKNRNSDLNAFLKWDKLGKGDATPRYTSLMAITKRTMGRGNPSPREMITAAITSAG